MSPPLAPNTHPSIPHFSYIFWSKFGFWSKSLVCQCPLGISVPGPTPWCTSVPGPCPSRVYQCPWSGPCTSVPGVAHVPVAGFASGHKSFRGCCGEPPSKPRNAKQCCHKRQNEKLKRTRKGFFSHIIIPCNDPLGQTNILDIAGSWSISVVANIFKNILPVLKLP